MGAGEGDVRPTVGGTVGMLLAVMVGRVAGVAVIGFPQLTQSWAVVALGMWQWGQKFSGGVRY